MCNILLLYIIVTVRTRDNSNAAAAAAHSCGRIFDGSVRSSGDWTIVLRIALNQGDRAYCRVFIIHENILNNIIIAAVVLYIELDNNDYIII